VPLRAWHGSADANVPLDAVREFVTAADGDLTVLDADHLGTLRDAQEDALAWLAST
jgi:uncharacterized protein related to proFAR isomerase